ncbi:hypothetical protein CSA37_04920 [Candidatus Fermentibacteria bacterium]|nr:MAG: hypothetical protein CSA37_10210 [Candidatus Fermentibacteria bacterium]PIE52270.1 MAG: hypothetical protein CSA37_07315 [Candidatus Fermentibacteria bacterium]PIE52765.1 MAG: hypothetical protein CSA37_04920 [Candidatus Fermentibacteria bacterium]
MNFRETVNVDRMIAAAAALAAFIVYLLTLAPSVSFWDSGEYITCSWVAGIPHPPGVPFFVLMGRFSTLLFGFMPSVAARVNLMCALAGTVTIGLTARLVQRWSSRMNLEPWLYRPVSAAAALLAGFSYTVWRNNNAAETYAMAGLLSMLILWVFDLWIERRLHNRPAGKQLLLTGYLMTLSIGNHLSALIVVLPIVSMYILYAIRKKAFEWKNPSFIVVFLTFMVLAFSVHLYMPLRAIQNPEINETNPCRWTEFRKALEREQYGQVSILDRKGPFGEQLGLFREYLSWQIGKPSAWTDPMGSPGGVLWAFLWLGLALLALTGLFALGAGRKDLLVLLGLTFFMASFAFVVYLNFKTGPEGTALGEVRERDYFFGASFIFFAVLSMIGAGSLFKNLKKSGARRFAWILMFFPLTALAANWHMCDRSGDYAARDYGINLLESCPENAVIITNGDNDTFPLWFAQGVLGVRRDVIISNLSLMNTRWYMKQLMEKDPLLLSYDPELVDSMEPVFIWGPNFFHVTSDGMPVTSPLERTILDDTFNSSWPWVMEHGELAITVPSLGRGNQGSVPMQDLLLINMVKNRDIHGREVVIAGTVASDNRKYVQDYLQMQGITFQIMDSPVRTEVNPDFGWEKSQNYLTTGLTDPGVYKDDQAVQIARNYASCYSRMAGQFLASGDSERALSSLAMAENLFSAMPEQWALIMSSVALIKARVLMGTEGLSAAREYVEEQISFMEPWAEDIQIQAEMGKLAAVADEFEQAEAFLSVIDSISDGSPEHEWIRIEASLAFGDYITARQVLGEIASSGCDEALFSLMEEMVDRSTIYSPLTSGLSIMDTALASVIGSMDQNSAELQWRSDLDGSMVITEMVGLASLGNVIAAVSAGAILGPELPAEEDRQAVAMLAERLIEDPELARQTALWYIIAMKSFSPEARSQLLIDSGYPALAWNVMVTSMEMDHAEAWNACFTGRSGS